MNEPVHFENSTILTMVFESAGEFGLTTDEILNTVMETLDHLPPDTKARYVDELAGALATRLLDKQRGSEGSG
jgi:hypothetical protein